MTTQRTLSGVERAALVILGLDEAVAAEILRHMDEADVRRIAETVDKMDPIPVDSLEQALVELEKGLQSPVAGRAGGTYLRRLTALALGEDRARHLLAAPARGPDVDALRTAKPAAVARLLEEEHPQIAALVLAQLPRGQAAKVVQAMPPERRADVLGRVSELETVPAQAARVASETLVRALGTTAASGDEKAFDGVAFAAGLLNELPPDESERILDRLGDGATKVREAMFTFEDLLRVPTRSMQLLMREVSSQTLLVALKTAGESLRDHFLGAVSSRAAGQIREDLAMLPPTRLSDVERAQREIADAALRLAADGRLVLPSASATERLV